MLYNQGNHQRSLSFRDYFDYKVNIMPWSRSPRRETAESLDIEVRTLYEVRTGGSETPRGYCASACSDQPAVSRPSAWARSRIRFHVVSSMGIPCS